MTAQTSEQPNVNIHRVNIMQAFELIEDSMFAKVVPFIRSSPGIGKSALVQQLADKHNLLVIDLRLSYCDPTDLAGFPWMDPVTKTASYIPMNTFPLTDTPLPSRMVDGVEKQYSGWVLFLDEFNSAPISVQAASYKLVLDRMAGMHKLHDRVVTICAGNLDTDGAITNPMSSASVSRMSHLEIKADLPCWIHWADKAGISSVITAFLEFNKGSFYTFDASNPDQVYACPRTWEFADRYVKRFAHGTGKAVAFPQSKMPLMAGTIGSGASKNFIEFMKYQVELPNMADLIKRPTEVDIPTNPGLRYALSGALADNATKDNVGELIKYIQRMPVENQVFCFRTMINRKPEVKGNPFITKWAIDNADFFF